MPVPCWSWPSDGHERLVLSPATLRPPVHRKPRHIDRIHLTGDSDRRIHANCSERCPCGNSRLPCRWSGGGAMAEALAPDRAPAGHGHEEFPMKSASRVGLAALLLIISTHPLWAEEIPGGSWRNSCKDIRTFQGVLYATCRTRDGKWVHTTLSLRAGVCPRAMNVDGNLRCGPG